MTSDCIIKACSESPEGLTYFNKTTTKYRHTMLAIVQHRNRFSRIQINISSEISSMNLSKYSIQFHMPIEYNTIHLAVEQQKNLKRAKECLMSTVNIV